MSEFRTWDEMTPLERAQSIHWDMYKDAYGVRPRGIDTSFWTLEDFEAEFKYLGKIIEEQETQRLRDEESAAQRFEARVAELQQAGARDRATALRWIHEAEGSNGDDEYLCYLLGLRYGYFRQAA